MTSVLLAPPVTEALLDGEALDGRGRRCWPTAGSSRVLPLKKTVTVHVPVASRTTLRPFNVVARIEGSDPAAEGRDNHDRRAPRRRGGVAAVDGDAIYNAADDNASGSAVLLAIAEQMAAAPRPKRTIVFIWDSGEEQGLWGTRWFVHAPPVPLEHRRAHQRGHGRREPAAGVGRRGLEGGRPSATRCT